MCFSESKNKLTIDQNVTEPDLITLHIFTFLHINKVKENMFLLLLMSDQGTQSCVGLTEAGGAHNLKSWQLIYSTTNLPMLVKVDC